MAGLILSTNSLPTQIMPSPKISFPLERSTWPTSSTKFANLLSSSNFLSFRQLCANLQEWRLQHQPGPNLTCTTWENRVNGWACAIQTTISGRSSIRMTIAKCGVFRLKRGQPGKCVPPHLTSSCRWISRIMRGSNWHLFWIQACPFWSTMETRITFAIGMGRETGQMRWFGTTRHTFSNRRL